MICTGHYCLDENSRLPVSYYFNKMFFIYISRSSLISICKMKVQIPVKNNICITGVDKQHKKLLWVKIVTILSQATGYRSFTKPCWQYTFFCLPAEWPYVTATYVILRSADLLWFYSSHYIFSSPCCLVQDVIINNALNNYFTALNNADTLSCCLSNIVSTNITFYHE